MKKTLNLRTPDDLHQKISHQAHKRGLTNSDYVRNLLIETCKYETPLHSPDLLFVFAYLEYNSLRKKDVCYYEVKHILSIIMHHYPNLEAEFQELFKDVIFKLNRFLDNHLPDRIYEQLTIAINTDDENSIKFDFGLFYKLTDGNLPYR